MTNLKVNGLVIATNNALTESQLIDLADSPPVGLFEPMSAAVSSYKHLRAESVSLLHKVIFTPALDEAGFKCIAKFASLLGKAKPITGHVDYVIFVTSDTIVICKDCLIERTNNDLWREGIWQTSVQARNLNIISKGVSE